MDADFLSQDEVDALLTGVDDDASVADSGDGEIDPLLADYFASLTAAAPADAPQASASAHADSGFNADALIGDDGEIDPLLAEYFAEKAKTQPAPVSDTAAASAPGLSTPSLSTADLTAPVPAEKTVQAQVRTLAAARPQVLAGPTVSRADLAQAAVQQSLKLPALARIAESFTAHLARGLKRFVRRDVALEAGEFSFVPWGNALVGTNAPRLYRMTLAPLGGDAVVAVESELAGLLVEHVFGGGRVQRLPDASPRRFGHTELRIVARLLECLIDAWRAAWAPVYPLESANAGPLADSESYARADDAMLTLHLQLGLAERTAALRLVVPYAAIQPLHALLRAGVSVPPLAPSAAWTRQLSLRLEAAEIEIAADLGAADITLAQVLALQAGDFIPLDVPATVLATVADEALLECQFGVSGGHYALRVERVLAPATESGDPT